MAVINARFRPLWLLAGGLSLVAGGVAFAFEASIHADRPCSHHGGAHLGYYMIFLGLALVPGLLTGVAGWRSRRDAADTTGPFLLAACLAVFLVFIGLAAAWGGHGCMV